MNDRVRLRVLRNFVASILSSNLSKGDIAEIADEIRHGGRLTKQMGEMLRDALMLLPDPPSERYVQARNEKPSLDTLAYDLVQRRKITKKDLVAAMGLAAPRLLKDDIPDASIRDLLRWFFDITTPTQGSRLLGLLGDTEPDPYLKGISRRS